MANDFRTFGLQLDDFARKVGVSGTTVAKRVGFDVFGRIVRKTPVDTGRARASWNISVNQADRSLANVQTTVKPGTTITKTLQRRSVKAAVTALQNQTLGTFQMKPGDTIWISNNLPYIVKLEEGHSKQAPAGMVAVSIAEVNVSMSRLVQEGLKDAGL
jgi:hypothetical protein